MPSRNPWRVRKMLSMLSACRARMEQVYQRCETDDERSWVLSTADTLEQIIEAGEAVATGYEDPRVRRRARKRPDMGTSRDAGAWMHGLYGD